MPKPSQDITWATDGTFTADADPWAGDANKIDPGATRRAEGAEPDTFPAEWFNYHLNAQGEHIEYIHDILEATDTIPAVTRAVRFSASSFHYAPTSGSTDLPLWSNSGNFWRIDNTADDVTLTMELTRTIPDEAQDVNLQLLIHPGTHVTVGTFGIASSAHDYATPAFVVATLEDTATTTGTVLEVLTLGPVDFVAGETYWCFYDSGGNMSAGFDSIYGVRITYTDPGPRNF